jgi:predicted MFS family arabinose efflux permease
MVQLYAVSLTEGTLFVFFNLAEVACLPRVVAKEQLPAAAARIMGTMSLSFLIGPALGGALFSLGSFLPFSVDAVSYVVSTISLLFISVSFQEERPAATSTLFKDIREGLHWLWHQPLIRYIAFLSGGYNFIWAGAPLVVIVLAQQLQASSVAIGLLFAVAGGGGVLGALIAPHVRKRFSFGKVIISILWTWVVLWPLQAAAPNLVVLGALVTGSVFISSIYDVVQFSYRMVLIPDALQGRVNSVFRSIAFGFQPLGSALAGVLLQVLGPIQTILIFFIPHLVLSMITSFRSPVPSAGREKAAPEGIRTP